jgi:tetratricopeptide (TPR) repeat protein
MGERHAGIPFRTFSAALLLAALASARPAAAALQAPPAEESPPDAADVAGELSDRPGDVRRAADLTRTAIRLIAERDWERAEAALDEALALVPGQPVNLYNLACVRAQRGRPDDALDALERAAAAGFSDFVLIARDPELEPVRGLPRFKALLDKKDEWQRRAAEKTVASLRARFGDDYVYGIDPDLKLIYATNVGPDTLDELKATIEAQARGQARDLFPNRPEAYVSVVVPSAADYRKIMRYRNVGGAYFNAIKTLVAQRPGDVMRHEFTHALHAADRAPLGQDHAAWVVEGLGVLYESAEILFAEDGDVLVPLADNPRLPAAQAAARRRSLVPLEHLLKMTQGEFMKRPNITYTEAGSLMLYLRDSGRLRKFYDAYKETYDTDPTGRGALEKASGTTLAEFETAWVKWLLERPAAPFFGAPTLFLGARVAPGGGGMTVIAVAPHGPAADGGIEPRDVIVAVNGRRVPDYASLRPALGKYTPGQAVALKVRRGDKEWDVTVKLQHLSSAPRRPPR